MWNYLNFAKFLSFICCQGAYWFAALAAAPGDLLTPLLFDKLPPFAVAWDTSDLRFEL
jgi:hypothetical protein